MAWRSVIAVTLDLAQKESFSTPTFTVVVVEAFAKLITGIIGFKSIPSISGIT